MYLHEHTGWTHFVWDDAQVLPLIGQVRFAQGELLGTIRHVGFSAGAKVEADMLANEVIASSRIEGVELDARSRYARRLLATWDWKTRMGISIRMTSTAWCPS